MKKNVILTAMLSTFFLVGCKKSEPINNDTDTDTDTTPTVSVFKGDLTDIEGLWVADPSSEPSG
ncbi:hypothetical protein OAD28_09320 [Flavobacteriales bacterium]|nr:hypothetical protein [Flavobacteriales bacterium]